MAPICFSFLSAAGLSPAVGALRTVLPACLARLRHFALGVVGPDRCRRWGPALALGLAVSAAAEVPAGPDYYTLAITLTPAFCDQTPRWRDSLQCRERPFFSVHGLWPERAQGRFPVCRSGPALRLTPAGEQAVRRLMPDAGLRRHEWEKHGRCSGLSAEEYFRFITREFDELRWPALLQPRGRDAIVSRQAVLDEFRRLNPGFPARGVMLQCERRGRPPLLTEIRVCLTPAGQPAACTGNFRPGCPAAVTVRAR